MKRREFLGAGLAAGVSAAERASFIWCSAADSPRGKQVYAAFRKSLRLTAAPSTGTLRIFADNRYVLWINGRYVERGPCRFDPRRPEYDTLNVAGHLHAGDNVIAVLVHYYAVGSFTKWSEQCARMMEHQPGLHAVLDAGFAHVVTDPSWRVNVRTGHLPSAGSYSSVPDNIDARIGDADWIQPQFDDSRWPHAVAIDASQWGPLHPRSIPLLRETPVPHRIVLPADLRAGTPLVFDLGQAHQVYSVWDLDAEAGAEFVVQHGMKEAAGFENRICRYVARQGRQTYMTTDTFGARFVEVRLKSGRARLLAARFVDRRYPYTRLGKFDCSDPVLNGIWRLGVNTVELCSEDAYVDCADRERAQWLADGYMMSYPVARVALAGPGPAYNDNRLLRNLLRHMAFSQLADGRLQPMRPSMYPPDLKHGVIDDYTCLWVQAVRELHERSGAASFTGEVWPAMAKALDYYLKRRTPRGLVNAQEFIYFNNPLAYQHCEGASINCFIHQALVDAAFLGKSERFAKAAADLRRAINRELWDEAAGSYSGGIVEGKKAAATGHAALIALYYGIADGARVARVRRFMLEHLEAEKPFPYTYRFLFDVLYRDRTQEADRMVLDIMRRKWEPMTHNATAAASESWGGYSYMHESGAHPSYFLSAFVLGVRTDSQRRLIVEPHLADLERAEGVVLCEHGPVAVAWRRTNQRVRLEIELPATAAVSMPSTGKIVVDGKPVPQNQFQLGPGRHTATAG